MQQLTLENRRGQALACVLHGELRPGLVITCHGMLSNKDGHKHQMLAELLTERGISVLRFDFAGCGESEGSLEEMTYTTRLHDLLDVMDELGRRGVERFGLFGSSMGGTVALLAAAREERIAGLCTLAAVAHPDAIDERHPEAAESFRTLGYVEEDGQRLGRALYDDAQRHDVRWAARIARAPMLILHGVEDDVVPCSDAHDIATAAREVSLELVEGADHRFSREAHLRPAMRKAAEFLAQRLA